MAWSSMLYNVETVDLLRYSLKKNEWIDLPAYGNSMYPIIKEGNVCRFIICDPLTLQKGDIILFHALSGQLVAHRFIEKILLQDSLLYRIKGDTNLGFDQPIRQEQILGKLLYIKKGNTVLYAFHFSMYIWGEIILYLPFLSKILRKYLNFKNVLKRQG